MTLRTTYTYVTLEISPAAYDEIAGKLKASAYDHCFGEDGAIDMHGLAITRGPSQMIPVGHLEVGHTAGGEVIVNHPDLQPDANGCGHIIFSAEQAIYLAGLLTGKAMLCREILGKQEQK
jgi:hypothetical protein